jgi:hypothetical protein
MAMLVSLVGTSGCNRDRQWSCTPSYERPTGSTLLAKDAFGIWKPGSIGTATRQQATSQAKAEDDCVAEVNGHVASTLTGGSVKCACFSYTTGSVASPSGFSPLK